MADKPPNLDSNDSDEEHLMATIELEYMQLAKEEQEGALLAVHKEVATKMPNIMKKETRKPGRCLTNSLP